ncbi:MAG: hypothetical protein ACAI38_00315 [Myxococcota bacterium]|nr:hypothetical protein [Myxococcota bacterium]
MDKRREFETYKALLLRLVRARGGDVAEVEREYTWPERAGAIPSQATAMAPLLTGGPGE